MTTRLAAVLLTILAALPLGFLLPAQEAPKPGRRVAFLVGIAHYDHDFPDLQFTERDMSELGKVLKNAGFEVVILTGSGTGKDWATGKNVEARLRALLNGDGDESRKVKKGDLVLVALSGHGQQLFVPLADDPKQKRDDAFFVPADGKPNQPDTLVSISHLVDDLLAPCGSRNLLLARANPAERSQVLAAS